MAAHYSPLPVRRPSSPLRPSTHVPAVHNQAGGHQPPLHPLRRSTRRAVPSPTGHPTFAPNIATAPPPDPTLLAQEAQQQRQLAIGNAQDQYQLAQIENEYGYGIDVSNPYSRARLLQQTYQNHMRGNTNSYANIGQLYAGSFQNAQDDTTRQYNISDDAMRRAYQAAKDAITFRGADRYATTTANVDQDTLAALLRAFGQ